MPLLSFAMLGVCYPSVVVVRLPLLRRPQLGFPQIFCGSLFGDGREVEVCGRALVSPYFTYPPPLSSIPPIPLPLSYSFNPVDACCVGVS
jgi:hypothetical protein